ALHPPHSRWAAGSGRPVDRGPLERRAAAPGLGDAADLHPRSATPARSRTKYRISLRCAGDPKARIPAGGWGGRPRRLALRAAGRRRPPAPRGVTARRRDEDVAERAQPVARYRVRRALDRALRRPGGGPPGGA